MGILDKLLGDKTTVAKEPPEEYTGVPIDVLIDGDILAYRASAATDGKRYNVRGTICKYHKEALEECAKQGIGTSEAVPEWVPEPESNAIHNLDRSIGRVLADISFHYKRPAVACVFVTGDVNFRTKIAPDYKSSRKGTRKPVHLKACKQQLLDAWDGVEVEGYEADDLICIESYARSHEDCVVASLDKDLLQIPGMNYNWAKKIHGNVSVSEGRVSFWRQVLTGDKTDDIPGLKGVGPVKARTALLDLEYMQATDYEYYKRVTGFYIANIPRVTHEDEFGAVKFTETKPIHLRRVLDTITTSAQLLHLCRDFEDVWQPPEKEAVTSDTWKLRLERLIDLLEKVPDDKELESVIQKVMLDFPKDTEEMKKFKSHQYTRFVTAVTKPSGASKVKTAAGASWAAEIMEEEEEKKRMKYLEEKLLKEKKGSSRMIEWGITSKKESSIYPTKIWHT